ncbi:amidohydrolase family protein [Bordetella genomosp. 4]|uniref:amidohydrolase family protein n=1 Tax=Bordetella genomosp. 4 TaxID=463044 RepID=UPI0020CDCF44|nr:amidohydrolase family protein [Bordetella genomosp. 4]
MMMATPPLPAGACDCHVHVVGDPVRYPMAADRHYTPGRASVSDLKQHMSSLGISRAVIVQPSVYGTDNACMLDGLRDLDGAGRGVAVLDDSADDAQLRDFHSLGVRGLRLNLESVGSRDTQRMRDDLQAWARRVAPLDWHLQVYASLDVIAEVVPILQTLPVPVVLDHFAGVPAGAALTDPRVQTVLRLVASGAAYVKLSAPYRIDPSGTAGEAVAGLAAAFIGANPDRMLWASDWPHTNREPGKSPLEVSAYRHIGSPRLAQEINAWLSDEALRARVLVENPARLYGF